MNASLARVYADDENEKLAPVFSKRMDWFQAATDETDRPQARGPATFASSTHSTVLAFKNSANRLSCLSNGTIQKL